MGIIDKIKGTWEEYQRFQQIGYERQWAKDRRFPLDIPCIVASIEDLPTYPVYSTDPEFKKLNLGARHGYLSGQNKALVELVKKYFGKLLVIMDRAELEAEERFLRGEL